MDTHNLVCDFGRHAGTLYTRMPVSYLLWMKNSKHSKADIAEAELARRGTTFPELEISGHAIDRASQRLLSKWQKTRRNDDEGLHSWLHRKAKEALQTGPVDDTGQAYIYDGCKWMFTHGDSWPTLTTVWRVDE